MSLLKIGGALLLGWATIVFGFIAIASIVAGVKEPAALFITIPMLGLTLVFGAFTVDILR